MPNEPYQYAGKELELFADAANWKKYIAARLEPYLGQSVLEVGAGIGANTEVLCNGLQNKWVCLEPDINMSARLRHRIEAGELPRCCCIFEGLMSDLQPARTYDTILYLDVLEHIEDDLLEVRNASAHLSKGGCLIVLAPAYPWLYSPFDQAIGHFRRYTRESLKATTPHGLKLTRAFYLDLVGVLASSVNLALLRRSMPSRRMVQAWDRCMVPLSRFFDPMVRYSAGRSVVAIWRRMDDLE